MAFDSHAWAPTGGAPTAYSTNSTNSTNSILLPQAVFRGGAELSHLLDIHFRGPAQLCPQMADPRDKLFLGMEQELVKRAPRLWVGLHYIFPVRQLKISMHLEAAAAAQQVFRGHSARVNVACAAERQRRSWKTSA